MVDLERHAARVSAQYTAAVLAKDADAFMRLYDPQARVFDTWGVWSYEGAAAWRVAVDGWFQSLGAERVRVVFDDVKVGGQPAAAWLSAMVSYSALAADGTVLRSMTNRLSWALRSSGHVLRIVHEHTSAPISFDEMKPMLQRLAAR